MDVLTTLMTNAALQTRKGVLKAGLTGFWTDTGFSHNGYGQEIIQISDHIRIYQKIQIG